MATDPLALEQAATQLRVAATTLSQALAGSGAQASPLTEAQTQRIRAIGTRLPLLRDQLARLLALTERQAASLLPPAQGVMTYGSGPGQGASRGARIYRAPG